MDLSEKVKRQAAEFIRIKGQKILNSRAIPSADIGRAWMTVNEMESGCISDMAVEKIQELKNVIQRDSDLWNFWYSNSEEFESILLEENV